MSPDRRVARAQRRVDEALRSLDYSPSYPIVGADDVLYLFVDCKRCGVSVRAAETNHWDHWRTHHRLRAALAEFAEQRRQRRSTLSAKPVHSETSPVTEP